MHKFSEGDSVRIIHWEMPKILSGIANDMNKFAGCEGVIVDILENRRFNYNDEFPTYRVALNLVGNIVNHVHTVREQFLELVSTEIEVDEDAFSYET